MGDKNTRTASFSSQITNHPHLGEVITLSSKTNKNNLEVGIAPKLGSNMFSFKVNGLDLITCDTDALALKHDFTGNFVLWPFPNRVKARTYRFDGKVYSLADVAIPKGNAVLVHGLVRDREWTSEAAIISQDRISVLTSVEMDENSPYFSAFPFPSRLILKYVLFHDKVRVEYTVQNLGTTSLPFGFALHPSFSTTLSGAEKTLISLPARTVMEANDELLPTGKNLNVQSLMYKMFDLNQPVPVSCLSLDHVYTDVKEGESFILDHTKQKMRVHFSTSPEFKYDVIYTLEGNKFVCLEPQTCATDAANVGKEYGLLVVEPGDSYQGFIEYTIEFY
jgi:aldose 1-epimerase